MYLILEIERPHKVNVNFLKTYTQVKKYLLGIDSKMSVPNNKFTDFHMVLDKANTNTDIYISLVDKKQMTALLKKLK